MTTRLFDFCRPGAIEEWISLNDVVMGGRSEGRLEAAGPAGARFTGTVSLEDGGGFASVRSRPRPLGLGGRGGLGLRARGDGRRYKLNMTQEQAGGILYSVTFEPGRGLWSELRFPFGEFRPTLRGRRPPQAPPLDPERVRSIGLMTADRLPGPFSLEIAWISALGDA